MGKADVVSVSFCDMGDECKRSVYTEEGSLVVREELSGPSVSVAYGGEERLLKLIFDPEHVDALRAALLRVEGCGSVAEYASQKERGVGPLMDLCDREGVPYTFISAGSNGDVQFRPSRTGVTPGSH